MSDCWRPCADKSVLAKRAQILGQIRHFFACKGVLEVDVPVIASHAVTDPNLSSLSTRLFGKDYFLQTSPEFFMKRLLADGSGCIYYLGKAFRNDEQGRHHNPEFTMLEWYREGFDELRLAAELVELVGALCPTVDPQYHAYASLFSHYLGLDPHLATAEELEEKAKSILDVRWSSDDKSTWLDLLFSHIIEPSLQALSVVYDYPESQCALAKVEANADGVLVAKRFEVFWQGTELANGYRELTDPTTQEQRFRRDLKHRERFGHALPEVDKHLLAAMSFGLPECAGVALGIDRLIMCLLRLDDIRAALAFPFAKV